MQIHGEVVTEEDARGGLPVVFYERVSGWAQVDAVGSGSASGNHVTAEENVFKSGMVGKTLIFAEGDPEGGAFTITAVLSAVEVIVDTSPVGIVNRPFTISAQVGENCVINLEGKEIAITDVFISQFEVGEFEVMSGELTVIRGISEEKVNQAHFVTPFICACGSPPIYSGPEDGLKVCLIQGEIT